MQTQAIIAARQELRSDDRGIEAVDQGPSALIEAFRSLSPEIAAAAESMDKTGNIPADLLDKIAATGIYRAVTPARLGGAGYRIPDIIPVFEALAQADGALAWSTFVGTELGALWANFPDEATNEAFADGAFPLARAPLSPRGTAARTEGGYWVEGRWPLASGAYPNDWALVGAVVTENGAPVVVAEGSVELRILLLPASQTRIVKTWNSLGLRASGSDDLVVERIFVPEHRSIAFGWEQGAATTLGRLPLWFAFGPFHGAVVLGIVRAMLDELSLLAQGKRSLLNPGVALSEDPLIQYRMGALETRLSAVRALLTSEAEAAWRHAETGEVFEPIQRARFRSMLAHVHVECGAIGGEVFDLAGSNVLFNHSSLQRRFRDLRTACQHIIGSTEIYRPFGALLMGAPSPLGTPL